MDLFIRRVIVVRWFLRVGCGVSRGWLVGCGVRRGWFVRWGITVGWGVSVGWW